jgi:hypothetical protein
MGFIVVYGEPIIDRRIMVYRMENWRQTGGV